VAIKTAPFGPSAEPALSEGEGLTAGWLSAPDQSREAP